MLLLMLAVALISLSSDNVFHVWAFSTQTQQANTNDFISLSAHGLGSVSYALSWYEHVMTLHNQTRQSLSNTLLLPALCSATEVTSSLLKYKWRWKG